MRELGASAAIAIASLFVAELAAQQPSVGTVPLATLCADDATAGSPAERTLMILMSRVDRGLSTVLRPLVVEESRAVLDSVDYATGAASTNGCSDLWTALSARGWYNTGSARSDRDGAVWQGRGVTMSLSGGIAWKKGILDVALRPVAFASENRAYVPAGIEPPPDDFRDPARIGIDLPYRFGLRTYASIDPGESHVRLRYKRAALGVTTESQHWGPAHFYPAMIGTEGAGYPRAFVEARSIPIWIGRATAHWQLGLLEASPYANLPAGSRSRVASAATVSFSPAGVPGLELGGSRFFHVRREPKSINWSVATLPFSGLVKTQSSDEVIGGFNQLASAFVRLAPVGAGVEAYGEFLRDDHNADLRDLEGEPDHSSAYVIGFRRVWKRDSAFTALTLERANGRISHLVRIRPQGPMYVHSPITEGHTFRGQLLGSTAIMGGSGTAISLSSIGPWRTRDVTVEIRATAQDREGGSRGRQQRGDYLLHFSETRAFRGRIYGATLGLQFGYGIGGNSNVTLAFHHAR